MRYTLKSWRFWVVVVIGSMVVNGVRAVEGAEEVVVGKEKVKDVKEEGKKVRRANVKERTAIAALKKFPRPAREAWLVESMQGEDFWKKNGKHPSFVGTDGKIYSWWDAKHKVANEKWNELDCVRNEESYPVILEAFKAECKRLKKLNNY